jgi:hypothetical protein
MEAKKFLVFIFLPPYFCHGLFVWSYSPAASGLFQDTACVFALVTAGRSVFFAIVANSARESCQKVLFWVRSKRNLSRLVAASSG